MITMMRGYIILLIFILFPACSPRAGSETQRICIRELCVNVESAQTLPERSKGLQLRESLGKDDGMLFVFPSSKLHSFWMKDTLIPLDMIWINQKKRIVSIIPNVLPCKTEQCPVYTPDKKALYVLEVNAGVTIEAGFKVGDKVTFR